MAEYVQWGSVPEDSSGGDKSEFLRMKTGNTYRIRPVFDPIKFFKYFHKHEGKLRTAICDKPDVCPVRDRHPELKKPSMRYAAYVIDRADGKVKILEAPQSVFRPIGSSFEAKSLKYKEKSALLPTTYHAWGAGSRARVTPITPT